MTQLTPGQVVAALVDACSRKDLDAVCALVTDDVVYDNVPVGVVHGPDGVRKVLSGGITDAATAIEWTVSVQTESGPDVMHERVDAFLVNGTWVRIPIAARFTVRDGKVSLWRDYFDLQSYLEQKRAALG